MQSKTQQHYYELYRKAKTDNITFWSITVDGDSYYTTTGILDGKKSTSTPTVCLPKNINKKNFVSAEDQAIREVLAKVKKKKEEGYVADIEEARLQDGSVQEIVMLAETLEDFQHEITDTEIIYVQPKLDGIRSKSESYKFISRKSKPFLTVPHIEKDVKGVSITLDGELYNHDLKDDFNELVSVIKQSKPTTKDLIKSEQIVQYHVYDCMLPGNFIDRYKVLEALFEVNDFKYLKLVPTYAITKSQINEYHDKFVEEGYEGIIIRRNKPYEFFRSKNLLKLKSWKDGEFEIIDVLEGTGNRSGMFGKFVLKDIDGETFSANALGNYKKYRKILEDKSLLIGKKVTVKYQNLTPRGVPRFATVVAIRDYE